MTLFDHLTIKSRMALSFFLIVILFIAFGYISVGKMNTLSHLTATLYTHPLQVSNASLKAKSGVISMHRFMKDVSIAKTQTAISIAIQQVNDEEKKIYQELALIKQFILGDEGKRLVEETTDFFTGWKPIRMDVQAFVMAGDTESANRITRERGAEYVAELERQMEALAMYARNKADGFMADAKQTQTDVITTVYSFIAILTILALCIGVFMSYSILKSIAVLQTTMTRITKTGDLEEAELMGNNEITQMSEHFNGLIHRLEAQFWLQEGENDLNQALSGDLEYDDILKKSIDHICRRLNACAGALYRFNPDKKRCELKSAYAFPKGRQFAQTFELNHGIVGQVAVEKKPILLENIQEADMVADSGTVHQPPLSLMAMPLFYEKDLLGVLEIASFEPIHAIKKQYLKSAVKIISVLLYTAAQTKQIKSLLEISQEANEKLQAQTEELQAQTEELQALNAEFQQQSEELKDQNVELELQRQQVEEANRLKSEFLSNMSHELRTPLNSVNALSRVLILQAKSKLSDEEVNYLEIIERNGKHLLSLINDILDLSKIEAGRMDIHPQPFSINTLIENIMESVAPLAEEKKIRFDCTLPATPLTIQSDESRLHQILQNIIANAVKFTDQGSVHIVARKNNDQLEIQVQDTGIGISTKDLETIFEEFRQVDGASTRKFEGTGLGLSIAYKAAKLLGGDINVNSVIGRGTTFIISLPLVFDGYEHQTIFKTQQNTQPEPIPLSDKNNTILIVDDDPRMRETLTTVFENEGYATLTAANGQEAIELAKSHSPMVITLDVIMPGMDGWEILSRLKKDPETAAIPIIIISVSKDKDTGYALGAVGYVTKPIHQRELIREINQIYGYLPATALVVEDNEFERIQTTQMITQNGMKALMADSGKSCLNLLEKIMPDVIILDLMMPEMDGFSLLETLRSREETKDVPVVVVTAKDLSTEEKNRLEKQVSSVLVKEESVPHRLLKDIRTVLRQIGKTGMVLDGHTHQAGNRILVVEDNEAAVIQVKHALETLGLEVDVASDGKKALEYLKHTLPQGIILDLMMPRVDGFEVVETLRSTPLTRELPVLILTAKDLTRDDLERLSANNIHQLIQKGDVDKFELLDKVSQMLKQKPVPESIPAAGAPGTFARSTTKTAVSTNRHKRAHPLVLIVEDNPDNMTTIKALLQSGLDFEEATDGEDGLEKAMALLPDLILLDMALPKLDGIEVVKRIKNNPDTRNITVIALTAQAMKGDRERIINAGCDDYVAKPINPEIMREKVSFWLSFSIKDPS